MGREARLRQAAEDRGASPAFAPYEVGGFIRRHTGSRLIGFFHRCPGHPDEGIVHFTTRALESATGVQLEAEVCDSCGRVNKLQRT